VSVVDTNVLVYAANASAAEHAVCRAKLDAWRQGTLPWCVTWPILYEFLRVVTHPRVFADPWKVGEAWRFVEVLLDSPQVQVLAQTSRHAVVAAGVLKETPGLGGNLLHDVHTAALMREHGIRRIYTRDADFHRFKFLEVVDPLGEP
jgi:toxin-antitoxin system PIN domain toxin